MRHTFGGNWTADKLERVRKYLAAYMQIMKSHSFRVAYIDAFAGTGYIVPAKQSTSQESLIVGQELREAADGSARIALQIEPRFTKYIFIERRAGHFTELQKLKDEFPSQRDDIIIKQADANDSITDLCAKVDWRSRRAVMFLDPYGMQTSWRTIEAIANTKAIDLWLLFPLGIAVNRLMRRDGKITPAHRRRLDELFGATDWYEAFYRKKEKPSLFDDDEGRMEKVANFDSIGQYFVERLKTAFPHVAENPRALYNSCNSPLYLLCFAAANEGSGGRTAVKIAQDILLKR